MTTKLQEKLFACVSSNESSRRITKKNRAHYEDEAYYPITQSLPIPHHSIIPRTQNAPERIQLEFNGQKEVYVREKKTTNYKRKFQIDSTL